MSKDEPCPTCGKECSATPRDIPSAPGYKATEWGGIISPYGKTISSRLDVGKYHRVDILNTRHSVQFLPIHRLVLEAFVGLRPHGYQCRHLDGNKSHNCIHNLRWGTPKEQGQDMVRHGSVRGKNSPTAKLTEKDVLEVRRRASAGESQKDIAADFGVSTTQISAIHRRRAWKHV